MQYSPNNNLMNTGEVSTSSVFRSTKIEVEALHFGPRRITQPRKIPKTTECGKHVVFGCFPPYRSKMRIIFKMLQKSNKKKWSVDELMGEIKKISLHIKDSNGNTRYLERENNPKNYFQKIFDVEKVNQTMHVDYNFSIPQKFCKNKSSNPQKNIYTFVVKFRVGSDSDNSLQIFESHPFKAEQKLNPKSMKSAVAPVTENTIRQNLKYVTDEEAKKVENSKEIHFYNEINEIIKHHRGKVQLHFTVPKTPREKYAYACAVFSYLDDNFKSYKKHIKGKKTVFLAFQNGKVMMHFWSTNAGLLQNRINSFVKQLGVAVTQVGGIREYGAGSRKVKKAKKKIVMVNVRKRKREEVVKGVGDIDPDVEHVRKKRKKSNRTKRTSQGAKNIIRPIQQIIQPKEQSQLQIPPLSVTLRDKPKKVKKNSNFVDDFSDDEEEEGVEHGIQDDIVVNNNKSSTKAYGKKSYMYLKKVRSVRSLKWSRMFPFKKRLFNCLITLPLKKRKILVWVVV